MTIYDIAREAGVSKSTVSRVINGEKVGEASYKKVLAIIKKYNYIPNQQARNLNKNYKKTILILMTRLDSFAETETIKGIVRDNEEDYEFMIFESEFDIKKSEKIIKKHKEVVGRIIFAIGNEGYEFLEPNIIPTVMIGQNVPNINSVYYNDKKAMRKLCEEIYNIKNKNIKKVLYLGLDSKLDPTVGKIREDEVVNFFLEKSISLDKTTTIYAANKSYEIVKSFDLNQYDVIIGATDRIILGVYKALLKQRLENKIIGGIGNNKRFNFIMDRLVTIDLSYELSGELAMDIIKNNSNKKKIECKIKLLKIGF